MRKIAIFSLSNKLNCESVARRFLSEEVEIWATGGTFQYLKDKGVACQELSELSGEPEIFGGRVKSLHHKILASVLFRPGIDDAQWDGGFRTVAVVCNFYPFREKGRASKTRSEMIEWIDIGGPTMVRAAAKNHDFVWVLSDPSQYDSFLQFGAEKIDESEMRSRLGFEAFRRVQELDQEIVEFWMQSFRPAVMPTDQWPKLQYGENPHQKAIFLKQLEGAKVEFLGSFSFNNVRDAEGGLRFIQAFDASNPAVAVVKHQTLCGAAAGLASASIDDVFKWAWEGDPVSRYGGILAFNFVPGPLATLTLEKSFVEVLVLPLSDEARAWAEKYRSKKEKVSIVLVETTSLQKFERIDGTLGTLVEERDLGHARRLLTTGVELLQEFGQWTAACSKSNAVTLCDERNGIAVLAGAGQGQPNRIDALEGLAIPRAQRFVKLWPEWKFGQLKCFSDAFIPFADFIEIMHRAGLNSLVQPGGSIRDAEVAAAAEKMGIEMRLTGVRHFWH